MSEHKPASKPHFSNSASQREIEKAEKQFDAFQEQLTALNIEKEKCTAKADQEPQTKLSQKEIENNNQFYLKPKRVISSKEKFNENFRKEYEFAKEYVNFTAQNNEVIGETIEIWTKRYPGTPAEMWEVPANRPVWGPRYLAEQIKNCTHHVFSMSENKGVVGSDGVGTYTGAMVVDTIKQRLDATPVSSRKSIFMGASGF